MTLEAVFNPDHPLSNIHGMVDSDGDITCKTHNGNLCTGCCEALEIRSNGFFKERGAPCTEQRPKIGCGLIIDGDVTERPRNCISYHCSKDIQTLKNPDTQESEGTAAKQRLVLSNASSYREKEISLQNYHENIKRIPKD